MSSNLSLIRLKVDTIIKPFDCNDPDLNEFLLEDAMKYHEHLLSVTYILEDENKTVGFFSVLNDKIAIDDSSSKSYWKRHVAKDVPHGKPRSSFPAVKVGRLGIHKDYKRLGYGKQFLDYIKQLFITDNRTGCRFITVDAYNKPDVLRFYEKNGFKYLTNKNEDDTLLMFYNLWNLKD